MEEPRRYEKAFDEVILATALETREKLIDVLSSVNESVLEHVLENQVPVGHDGDGIQSAILRSAIRKGVLSREFFPVLCGSSLKNRGVQSVSASLPSLSPFYFLPDWKQLLDSVNDYLPSPPDMHVIGRGGAEALVFKVVRDPIRGALSYVRVYNGELENRQAYLNTRSGEIEKINKLLW